MKEPTTGSFQSFAATVKKSSGRFAFELLIVFLGVYLAFLIADYQEERRMVDIRVNYYESLILEFESLLFHLRAEESKLAKHLEVVAEIEQGLQPALIPSDLNYSFRGSVVRSAFESQHFESLDESILHAIIGGVMGLEMLENSVNSLNLFTATVLLPMQVYDSGEYYDANGTLLPHLAWYPRLVQEISTFNGMLQSSVTDRAIPDLRASIVKLIGAEKADSVSTATPQP